MRVLPAVALVFFVPFGTHAAVRVTLNGTPAVNAEVCGFRAAGSDTPFHQHLAASEIVCSTEFEPGLWNVFARQASVSVSARSVLIDTRKPLPDVELRLEPAATVVFAADDRTRGFVYVTDTLSAFPAGKDGVALVPAGRDLLPLLVRNAAPVAIGEPIRLAAGEKRACYPQFTRAIATWVAISAVDLEALRGARSKRAPQVKAGRLTAMNPIRGTVLLNGAMQFIRDVPAGPAVVEVSGAPWKRSTVSVAVPATGVAVTAAPLLLVPTSSVAVRWSARRDLAELVANRLNACTGAKEAGGEQKPVVSLLSCSGYQPARSLELLDRDRCSVTGTRQWERGAQSGDVAFENVDPGAYVVEFTYGDLPAIREPVRLERFDQETLVLQVDYTTLYGRVTVAGSKVPAPVELRFKFTDSVFSDEDGDYAAVLAKPLTADRVISIRGCDGSLDGEHIVERDVLANSRYDIDLPANRITVEAVDADGGTAVTGALVRYGAFRSEEMSSLYYFRLAYTGDDVPSRTDNEGRFVIKNLPAGKSVRVCLEHDDYERTCPDPITLTSTQQALLRVPMKAKGGFKGRITGATNVTAGQLYWFAQDGRESERTNVRSDGTFRFARQHAAGEAVVFVSANLPLFAFTQQPLEEGDSMVVTMPAAAVRTFEIAIGPERTQLDAVATVAIGGLVVPYPAFAQHCALHGSQLELRNRGPLIVPDILETGPLYAILGPPLAEITPEMRRVDLFRLPQFRGLPRKLVTQDRRVVFLRRGVDEPGPPRS